MEIISITKRMNVKNNMALILVRKRFKVEPLQGSGFEGHLPRIASGVIHIKPLRGWVTWTIGFFT